MYSLSQLQPVYIAFGTSLLLSLFYGTISGNPNTFKVSKEVCANGVVDETVNSTCCRSVLDDDLITKNCLVSSKVSEKAKNDKEGAIRFSVFVECVYSKKKFIRTDTELHIRHIKAEAKKLYPDDTQRRKFMVNMYRDCGEQATKIMEQLNSASEEDDFLKELHKPYFINVYFCVSHYSLKKCPYFRWNTSSEFCQKWTADCQMMESSKTAKKLAKEGGSEKE